MTDLLDTMIQAVKSRIGAIRANHAKYTLTSDAIQSKLSVDYTTVPLTRTCNKAKVYYCGESIAAYRKMLDLYSKILNDNYAITEDICDQLETYVAGWSSIKVITPQNLKELSTMIEARKKKIQGYIDQMNNLMGEFQTKNTQTDEMVDHITINLFENTKEFPYRKAYGYFFKKFRIKQNLIQTHIDRDIGELDTAVQLLDILQSGWDKSGKNVDFEIWRDRQRKLITIIQSFADLVETDIHLYELFITLSETVINFKIFPA